MVTRTERIAALTPAQALDVVQYMTADLAERQADLPSVSEDQQAEVLAALFREQGYPEAVEPGGQDAGESARQLLRLLAESDDQAVLDTLDKLLARPPRPATGGGEFLAVLEAARPIILTACLVILTTRFKFKYKEGKLSGDGENAGFSGKNLTGALAWLSSAVKGWL